MEATKSKTYLSWEIIDFLVDNLCSQIIVKGIQVEHIFGLQRGGLIPAVMISHRLNIPMTTNPNLPNVLVVDDICDSGETFIKWSKKYPDVTFACLHLKPHTTSFIPDIWVETYKSDNWIVYPWERDDSETIQDYLK